MPHETLNQYDGVDANQLPDGRVRNLTESNWKGYVGACHVPRTNVPARRSHCPPRERAQPWQMPEIV